MLRCIKRFKCPGFSPRGEVYDSVRIPHSGKPIDLMKRISERRGQVEVEIPKS